MAALAAAAAFSGPAPAGSDATCTQAQKDARTAALAVYRKRMPVERRAHFAKVKAPAKRAAFVRRQQARLTQLRTAAACSVVTPLPPPSAGACDFMLERNREGALVEPFIGAPMLNVGPINRDVVLPASGRAEIVLLFVDFPGAPANETASTIASAFTAYTDWFAEASYGRFSVSVAPVPMWFRLPRPGSEYRVYTLDGSHAYMADVVAAADAAVDFSRYHAVWVVAAANGNLVGNTAFARAPGRGVHADGVEIRFGTLMGSSRWPGLFASTVAVHEHLHSMGLPDLGYAGKQLGRWDPMYADNEGTGTAHVLGWHKRILGWIDADQVTCVREPGSSVQETLAPLARPGGKKLVVVPTSPSTAYAIEARRKVGYDRSLCAEGVLVYTVDSQVRGAEGPIEGRSASSRCAPQTSPLAVGETYEDGAVKVEVLATDGSAYRVRVTKR